jgi:carotenoid 1,2-hydratase
VDALSDDGQFAMTAIAFIGSVFSPYYASARRRGGGDPVNHCAFNVALYGARGGRWAMTERGSAQVDRQSTMRTIGPSDMRWTGSSIDMHIDEICAPVPRRMRGTLRVLPEALHADSFALDEPGLHTWTPYAPRARIEVHMKDPDLAWSGVGYFDHNSGSAPLEEAFDEWTWSRVSLPDSTAVFFDTKPRAGHPRTLALQYRSGVSGEPIPVPREIALARTRWGLTRNTRCDDDARLVRTLVDAPFYSRSQLDVGSNGMRAPAIHESLSLQRFRSRWVRALLPFRMPRITRGFAVGR